jgi:hypothetical protein
LFCLSFFDFIAQSFINAKFSAESGIEGANLIKNLNQLNRNSGIVDLKKDNVKFGLVSLKTLQLIDFA